MLMCGCAVSCVRLRSRTPSAIVSEQVCASASASSSLSRQRDTQRCLSFPASGVFISSPLSLRRSFRGSLTLRSAENRLSREPLCLLCFFVVVFFCVTLSAEHFGAFYFLFSCSRWVEAKVDSMLKSTVKKSELKELKKRAEPERLKKRCF